MFKRRSIWRVLLFNNGGRFERIQWRAISCLQCWSTGNQGERVPTKLHLDAGSSTTWHPAQACRKCTIVSSWIPKQIFDGESTSPEKRKPAPTREAMKNLTKAAALVLAGVHEMRRTRTLWWTGREVRDALPPQQRGRLSDQRDNSHDYARRGAARCGL